LARNPAQVANAAPVVHSPVISSTLSQAIPLSMEALRRKSKDASFLPLTSPLATLSIQGWGAWGQPMSEKGFPAKEY